MTATDLDKPRWNRPVSSRMVQWVLAGSLSATAAGLTGYLYLVDPNNPASAYPQCPMKVLTGLDCPGCGGLRATNAMLHGDFVSAFDHNFLALIIVPLMAYGLARFLLGLFGKEMPAVKIPTWGTWAIPTFMLVFSIVRNVPIGPFKYLASETY